jgi:putative endonuclease
MRKTQNPSSSAMLSMFSVYVLKSASLGKRYVGSTANLVARLQQHNQGRVRATKGGRPWELVYSEDFPSNAEARRREISLKSGKGRAELDEILAKRGSAP